jgi:hypothetical protein
MELYKKWALAGVLGVLASLLVYYEYAQGSTTSPLLNDLGTAMEDVAAADAEGVISFVANSALPGDYVLLFNDGVNWYVSGQGNAAGSITFTT